MSVSASLAEILRSLPLLAQFSDNQLAWTAEHGDLVQTEAGELVFSEDGPSEAFYILIDGAMQLTKPAPMRDDPGSSHARCSR
jgi:CRP-like cAMP-binding protein